MFKIEHDSLLVAMETDKIRRLSAGQMDSPSTRDVAARGLDLNDARAVVGEHVATHRTGHCVAEIENGDTFEWHLHKRLAAARTVYLTTQLPKPLLRTVAEPSS